jgi:methyltransferase (TIGR00027 family)
MQDYLRSRTAFFDRTVVAALDRGVRQVVIGAAGYDGRPFRYARDGVRWFEVDHPATQADKRARLDRLGISARHVTFVAADFTADSVAKLLLAGGLDPAAPALFCFEGIAAYLDDEVTERVLAQFRQVTPVGSVLAISVSASSDREARDRLRQRVAALGEPFRSSLTAGTARDLLSRAGWHMLAPETPDQERAQSAGLLTASGTGRATGEER